MSLPTDDTSWLTLCLYYEARGECQDGKAAVAKVVLNRTRRTPPFFSHGTVSSTILWPMQFSWTQFAMVDGHYFKVAQTASDELAQVGKLFTEAQADKLTWATCEDVAHDVLAGTYEGGPDYQKLGPDALLYDNLAVSQPDWATPEAFIAQIGRHSFYRNA